ncbi:unnamed protein product [Kuraishia capsulata CBS 1993]|uniref:Uncharacterized protein n=1 Tax=Kuraishia capsulata CBS 1993 TaxID=1382522 RepID=W6ML03_9ASCO|nr:uncharacterized protein KUCA_T00001432001 [Kuraishia capsulata CBS 1993]CDK25462.1 unnamed protein product [Kuraishia capsulata CBS 1993]
MDKEETSRSRIRLFIYVVLGLLPLLLIPHGRASRLPLEAIEYYTNYPTDDISVRVPVYVYCEDLEMPDLAAAVQIQVDHQMNRTRDQRIWQWTLDIRDGKPEHFNEYYSLKVRIGAEDAIHVDNSLKYAELFVKMESIANNDVPFFVTQTLLFHIFHEEVEQQYLDHYTKTYDSNTGQFYIELDRDETVVEYGSDVKVLFTLFASEDLSGWELSYAISEYFEPLCLMISRLVNMTVESQVIYLDSLNYTLEAIKAQTSQLDADQTINLAIYPMPQRNIQQIVSGSNSSTFLIPQWGAIYLYPLEQVGSDKTIRWNHLEFPMEEFTSRLFQMLGLVKHPKSPQLRFEITQRLRILSNVLKMSQNLLSVEKLSKKGKLNEALVKNVFECLRFRNETVASLNSQDWDSALSLSNLALERSNRAFFDENLL